MIISIAIISFFYFLNHILVCIIIGTYNYTYILNDLGEVTLIFKMAEWSQFDEMLIC